MILGILTLAGLVVSGVVAALVRSMPRASFAVRATVLQCGTLLLLVVSAVVVVRPYAPIRTEAFLPRTEAVPPAASPQVGTAVHAAERNTPMLLQVPRDVIQRAAATVNTDTRLRAAAGILTTVWLLGVVLTLFRLARGALYLSGVIKRAQPAVVPSVHAPLTMAESGRPFVRVLISDEVDIPFVSGWRAPVIVLPGGAEAWTLDEWHAVLRHELAHVTRGDLFMQWASQLTIALHWHNPAVHWLARRADEACEGACDDAVLLSGVPVDGYVSTLLAFSGATWAHSAAPAATMAGRGGLERRISAAIEHQRVRRTTRRRDYLGMRVAGVCGGVMFAVVLPQPTFAFNAPPAALETTSVSLPQPSQDISVQPTTERVKDEARAIHSSAVVRSDDVTEALLGLGEALRDTNPIVRDAARRALGEWQAEENIARLRLVVRGTSEARRRNASAALAAMTVAP